VLRRLGKEGWMENFGCNFEQGVHLAFFICIRKLINYCANLYLLFDNPVNHLKVLKVRPIFGFRYLKYFWWNSQKWRYSLLHCLTLKHGIFYVQEQSFFCFLNFTSYCKRCSRRIAERKRTSRFSFFSLSTLSVLIY